MNKSIASTQEQKNKRYSVKKPSIAHFFVSQSRLTDAVSVIFGELLSYEHPPKTRWVFFYVLGLRDVSSLRNMSAKPTAISPAAIQMVFSPMRPVSTAPSAAPAANTRMM